MVERPQPGREYVYTPSRGQQTRVRCIGFRRGYIECRGVEDGLHRSISPKQLEEI